MKFHICYKVSTLALYMKKTYIAQRIVLQISANFDSFEVIFRHILGGISLTAPRGEITQARNFFRNKATFAPVVRPSR